MLFCVTHTFRVQVYKFKDKISNMAAQMLGQAGKSCQFCLLDTMKNKFSYSVRFQVFGREDGHSLPD